MLTHHLYEELRTGRRSDSGTELRAETMVLFRGDSPGSSIDYHVVGAQGAEIEPRSDILTGDVEPEVRRSSSSARAAAPLGNGC